MELRKNWETWFRLEEKRIKEDLTEAERKEHYNSSMFVFDYMEDFVVPYSLLMDELKQYMNLIESKGIWELQIEKMEQEKDEYCYQVAFINKVENKKLPIVRVSSNVRKANMSTFAELKGEKEGVFVVNLLKDTKTNAISLANITRRAEELPVDSDALLDVLWKVVKECKVLRLKEEKLSLGQQLKLAENRKVNLEKEMEIVDTELEELEK